MDASLHHELARYSNTYVSSKISSNILCRSYFAAAVSVNLAFVAFPVYFSLGIVVAG